ncbi:MAG: hypothetical protein ACREHC_01060 [Candidatus Levyibacteriota bacterium]
MVSPERRKVNRRNGELVVPSQMCSELGLRTEGEWLRAKFKTNRIYVSNGTEIVLADSLIPEANIVEVAQTLDVPPGKGYRSPITLFNSAKFTQAGHTTIVGSNETQTHMDLYPIRQRGLLAIPVDEHEEPNQRVYEDLPGYPTLDWIRRPDISPHALKAAYTLWRDERSREVTGALQGKEAITILPEHDTELGKAVLLCVMKDILSSAAEQIKVG